MTPAQKEAMEDRIDVISALIAVNKSIAAIAQVLSASGALRGPPWEAIAQNIEEISASCESMLARVNKRIGEG